MHPFWAVRRLTRTELSRMLESWTMKPTTPRPRFNCCLRKESLRISDFIVVGGEPLSDTRCVEVPFLVNSVELHANEELLLEIEGKWVLEGSSRAHTSVWSFSTVTARVSITQSSNCTTSLESTRLVCSWCCCQHTAAEIQPGVNLRSGSRGIADTLGVQ